jgi:DNA polymerase-3 subunit epsilon
MKYCFIDLETTGTDPQRHAIIQIAGELWIDNDRPGHPDRNQILTFDHLVRPLEGKEIDDTALAVNKRTREEIMTFPDAKTVHAQLVHDFGLRVSKFDKRDKMFLVAYFAQFDDGFLRQWFKDLGDNYFGSWFWWPPIDVAQIALSRLRHVRHELPDFKLLTVALALGFEPCEGRAHDAKADIQLTRSIFHCLEDQNAGHATDPLPS